MGNTVCVGSFCAQRADDFRSGIRTASPKAKIFRSVLCSTGLKHETGPTMCLVVVKCFANENSVSRSGYISTVFGTDLYNHLRLCFGICCKDLRSI